MWWKAKNSGIILLIILSCCTPQTKTPQIVKIYLIGDSTMADYADNYDEGLDYFETRFPVTGWGQVFPEFFKSAEVSEFGNLFHADSVEIENRARGGRSTRTFFQEGRWRSVHDALLPGDIVIMQFGHNDAAVNKQERYVDIDGYKEFLRLYISQSKAKGAIPIILTPVARNYPWVEDQLENVHGSYWTAAIEVAEEMGALLIDLNQMSMSAFSKKGKDYVSKNYFMNLDSGVYKAYPNGVNDNTHFQPEGAKAVASLVFEAMKSIRE